uniref:ADAM metallopeptidase domain 28 n=1 Tax=Neogobius melanostomus TaxID=47308 RepID=A0A8C6T2L0_9GOBI
MQETKLDESYCVVLSTVSHGPGLNVGENYEVVRPIRLHTVDKRDWNRPQRVKYALTVGGRPLELHLERNDQLLSKDYSETHYLEDGTRVTTTPQQIDNCYYQGKIVGEDASEASISTCDGLSGYFRTSAQRYLISPLSSEPEGDHAVTALSGEQSTPPRTCGVTNNTWAMDEEPPSRTRSRGLGILTQQKYVELYLVTDKTEFLRMGKDKDALRKRVFEVVNFVNMAYKPLLTFVALVGLEIWTSTDRISITSNTGQNLDNFMIWRNKELINTKHDCAHLIRFVMGWQKHRSGAAHCNHKSLSSEVVVFPRKRSGQLCVCNSQFIHPYIYFRFIRGRVAEAAV